MPVPESHAPLERDLLRDRAYATLRDAIVDGTLAPGERLRDQELCEWLGLSRTPVRDAFPIVAAVHALAAELGVPRLTATDLEAMREANTNFAAALKEVDVDAA